MDHSEKTSAKQANLEAVARAYVRAADLEEATRAEGTEPNAELTALRTNLHALLIEALRDNRISFIDPAHASQIAHQIVLDQPAD